MQNKLCRMKLLIAIFSGLFLFTSCNSQSASVKNLNPSEFEKGITQPNVLLIDVRTPEEFKEKHISGAKNVNVNDPEFEKRMLELDKSKPTYVYCLAGARSKKAADFAAANGFKEVYNLESGINAWMGENKEVVSGLGEKVQTNNIGMSFDDYLNHLKASPKLVLVDFNAVWCGPCKTLKPIVNRVVKKNADKVDLFEIDVDKNSTVAHTMNVRAIPLLILYKQGKEVWRSMGLVEEELITDKVTQFSK
jgi:thioredoxin 1